MRSMNRRKFLKISVVTGGAASLGTLSCEQTEINTRRDPAVAGLKPDNAEIVPINIKERKSRIDKAQRLMHQNRIDALFLESGSSLYYFTGIRWGRSERLFGAVIHRDGKLSYICPAFEEERARERIILSDDVRVWQEDESPYKLVAGILKDNGLKTAKIGIEEKVRFFIFNGIRHEIPGVQFVTADPVTAGCRMIKSATEIALMQRANNSILKVYKTAFAIMEEGMTQSDFNANCSAAFKALNIKGSAWAQFGENSALPHGSSRKRTLRKGDIVLVDGLASVEGYYGDISRTTVFGKPSQVQTERWQLARKAQDVAFSKIKPGISCEDIDEAARKVIHNGGYGPDYENFYHRLGHGIGLDYHEWAYLVRGNKTSLQPGMCFSNEPGIYVPGEFGVRVEDCFYVTEKGYQSFTQPSPGIDQPVL